MANLGKTPLAWKNLTHDKRRLAVALAGISFAVLLMFTQVGFQRALFDSQTKLIKDLNGKFFIVSKAKYTLAAESRVPMTRLHQARSVRGVKGAYPVYTELSTSALRELKLGLGNKSYPIRTIGFYLEHPVFELKKAEGLNRLHEPHTALIDTRSKESKFPFATTATHKLKNHDLELSGKSLELVGAFDLGTDFAHDGNLLMSAENFARYFPQHNRVGDPLSVFDIGVVHLHEGADPVEVRKVLDGLLGDDLHIYEKEEFIAEEEKFWNKSTPIGTIFMFGKVIGFIVGTVICYQVIYSDITDHLPEFATLKAMGYPSKYFVRLIVVEAVLLAIVGFIPGMAVSQVLYMGLSAETGLLMTMSLKGVANVLAATIAMCVCSGLLALRKLLAADPASLF